jgi:single-strand DNA-binding protein
MHRIFVTGNVGQDPVVKSFENGGKVANFSVADTEKGYKTKDGKDVPDHTEWFRCVVKQTGLCNVVEQYIKKGMHVEIIGKLKTREYEKDGQKLSTTELIVEQLNLPPKGHSDSSQPSEQQTPTPKDDDLPW